MNRDARHIAIVAVLALLIAIIGGAAGWCMRGARIQPQVPPVPDTTWFTLTDTVTLVEPRVDTLVRFVDRLYPVAVHDTTWVVRHTTDSIWITLPYQHRHYSQPDTLEVWYSGVDPKIDSARVYMHHTTEIIKQPYEVARMPRLTLDLGAAAFYSDKRVNPCLVGEMRYNAPRTTFGTFTAIDPTGQWCAGASVSYRLNVVH